jgi:chromosomal replication initiator protein
MNKGLTVPLAFGCHFCTLPEPHKDERYRILVATHVAQTTGGGCRKDPLFSIVLFAAFADWFPPLMSTQLASSIEQQLREELTNTIGKRPYRMWFTNTEMQCHEDHIDIYAATPLAAGWISNRFSSLIEDAAKNACGREIPVHISVQESTSTPQQPSIAEQPARNPVSRKSSARQLLRFDDFIVGSCNQLACAAAKQITEKDGNTISPLFIHGACGVGKTHLLQAICHRASKLSPGKVRYVTAEQFTNEFIASSRSGEFSRFRTRYRNLDLLAIDDVHFVANKIKTQEELLHTLDAAGLRGARLILASDEDPRHIRRLNRALANRFVAGMIAEVQRPDRETRCNIINKLTQQHGIAMTPSAVEHLASQAVGSVREIEGTVTRLRATAALFAKAGDATIGIDAVTRLLRSTPPTSLPIRIGDVIGVTAARAGLSVVDLRGSSRASHIVFWRSIASYLGRKLTSHSYPELASAVGRKNHSTVHAAVKRITQILEQPTSNIKVRDEPIDVREVVDQLTWAVRAKANENKE